MIKLSKEATERHDIRTAWPSLLVVALLFGLIFGFEMLAGHIPSLRSTGALLLLNAYWAYTVYIVARFGFKAYQWPQYLNLIGCSILLGRFILPHSFIAGSPAQSLATAAILLSFAPRFFTVSRKTPVAAEANR